VSSDFYVAALCNLGFTICGSYIEQVWPPLIYAMTITLLSPKLTDQVAPIVEKTYTNSSLKHAPWHEKLLEHSHARITTGSLANSLLCNRFLKKAKYLGLLVYCRDSDRHAKPFVTVKQTNSQVSLSLDWT